MSQIVNAKVRGESIIIGFLINIFTLQDDVGVVFDRSGGAACSALSSNLADDSERVMSPEKGPLRYAWFVILHHGHHWNLYWRYAPTSKSFRCLTSGGSFSTFKWSFARSQHCETSSIRGNFTLIRSAFGNCFVRSLKDWPTFTTQVLTILLT